MVSSLSQSGRAVSGGLNNIIMELLLPPFLPGESVLSAARITLSPIQLAQPHRIHPICDLTSGAAGLLFCDERSYNKTSKVTPANPILGIDEADRANARLNHPTQALE